MTGYDREETLDDEITFVNRVNNKHFLTIIETIDTDKLKVVVYGYEQGFDIFSFRYKEHKPYHPFLYEGLKVMRAVITGFNAM